MSSLLQRPAAALCEISCSFAAPASQLCGAKSSRVTVCSSPAVAAPIPTDRSAHANTVAELIESLSNLLDGHSCTKPRIELWYLGADLAQGMLTGLAWRDQPEGLSACVLHHSRQQRNNLSHFLRLQKPPQYQQPAHQGPCLQLQGCMPSMTNKAPFSILAFHARYCLPCWCCCCNIQLAVESTQ